MHMKDLIFYINLIIIIHYISNAQIHILRNTFLAPTRRERDINKVEETNLSKLCKTILSTNDNLGNNPFQIYKFCPERLHLLGSDDEIIIKEQPFCFENLEKFFCNFKIFDDATPNQVTPEEDDENSDVPLTDNSEPCEYENLTNMILSAIQGCLADEEKEKAEAKNTIDFKSPDKDNKKGGNKCPSLNYESFKIQDKVKFCKNVQKKDIIPLPDGGEDLQYIMVKDNQQIECGKIIDLYNLCIDTDYLLYPNSKYKRCYNKSDGIYSCNIIKSFKDKYQKEMCSNYVISNIAIDFNKGKIKDVKEYCLDYDNKLTMSYNNEIENIQNDLNKKLEYIKILNEKKSALSDISKKSLDTLNVTSTVGHTWIKFFPLFSITFKQRVNITATEQIELNNLRKNFDESFNFLADLDRLRKDPNFIKSNFTENLDKFSNNLRKIDSFFISIIDICTSFLKLIEANKDLTLDKDDPQFKLKFVANDFVSKEEIISFQNEFTEMLQYAKNYMNYIMREVKKNELSYDSLVIESQNRLKELQSRSSILESKKTKLAKDLLKG